MSNLNNLAAAVEQAENFASELPDVTYDVQKTLHGILGKKVTRRLKLTLKGVANLRSGGSVSSLYEYDRIIKVTMSNVNTLVLEYKGAKHPYVYSSPVRCVFVSRTNSRSCFVPLADRCAFPV